jgi:hypothetical protein
VTGLEVTGMGVFVSHPRLSEGIPNAPFAGYSGTDIRGEDTRS